MVSIREWGVKEMKVGGEREVGRSHEIDCPYDGAGFGIGARRRGPDGGAPTPRGANVLEAPTAIRMPWLVRLDSLLLRPFPRRPLPHPFVPSPEVSTGGSASMVFCVGYMGRLGTVGLR